MNIKGVKISNVLSFGFKQDFNAAPYDITFENGLNIIVGANGSGKSNFVEILFTLFQSYFLEPYEFNTDYDNDSANHPRYIQQKPNAGNNLRLEKHFDTKTQESEIEISINLSDGDKKNLQFIKDNFVTIKALSSKYALVEIDESLFPITYADIDNIPIITFRFKLNNTNQEKVKFELQSDGTDIQKLVDYYFRNFDLFKRIINTARERDGMVWETLVISFEFLGAHRNFGNFPPSLSFNVGQENHIGNLEFNKKNANIKNSVDVNHIFNIPLARAGNCIAIDSYGGLSVPDAINKQFTDPDSVIFKVNKMLKEYLHLNIRYKAIPPRNIQSLTIEIFNVDNNTLVSFEQLSSGQKSIFSLIFLVVGLEIKQGLLVIDEPEIHLHPKLQKKYFNLLKEFSNTRNLQSILITHSPVFIDEKTIRNTYRFYIKDFATEIVKGDVVATTEEDLIKFLSYTNSAKVFFTTKVILVEGETDSYFYSYFLNKIGKSDKEFEILPIQGKHEYQKWFDFLDKLKIETFLITDFDFLDKFSDLGIDEARNELLLEGVDPETIKRVQAVLGSKSSKTTSNLIRAIFLIKDKKLGEITQEEIDTIKDIAFCLFKKRIPFANVANRIRQSANLSSKLESRISEQKKNNIYVLKYGSLEDYLALPSKGLQLVVDYCANDEISSMNQNYKQDLDEIFEAILPL